MSPDAVWHARGLLLFTASVTYSGSKYFDCALVSTLESCDDPENGNCINYVNYMYYSFYMHYAYIPIMKLINLLYLL